MPIPQQIIPPVFLIAGLTGSGKTALIQYLIHSNVQALDIERICRHDGSVFAKLHYPSQPTSYQFHKALLKKWALFDPAKPVFIESELKKLGHINLPEWLYQEMRNAPVIWLDTPKKLRIERMVAIIRHSNPVLFGSCLSKLDKKLGKENFELAVNYFQNGEMEKLAEILLSYYDHVPGYAYPEEKIILNKPFTNSNLKFIAAAILEAANIQCSDAGIF